MVKLINLPLRGLSTKYPLNRHVAGITKSMRLTHLGSRVCIGKTIETAIQAKKLAQNFEFEQPANDLGLSLREICTVADNSPAGSS
jgi:hypothetical protein